MYDFLLTQVGDNFASPIIGAAPVSLTATADSDSIALAWTNGDTYTGIVIMRKTTGDYSALDTAAGDAESYDDITALPGITYTYKVRGIKSTFPTSYSNEAFDTISVGAPTRAAEFLSGENKKLSVTHSSLNLTGIDFSICGWFRQTTPTDNQNYIFYGTSTGTDSYAWYLNNADNSILTFNVSDGLFLQTYVESNAVPFSSTWHFFCVTFNNTTKALRLSIDDGTPGTATFTLGTLQSFSAPLTIGTIDGDTNYDTSCFGIWTRVLTGTEITSLYGAGHARIYTALSVGEKVGLQNYWNLDELSTGASPVTRVDSVNARNLTDTNNVVSTTNVPS